jgi:hypothetical protein
MQRPCIVSRIQQSSRQQINDLHERGDDNYDPFAVSVQSVGPVEVENLTSDNRSLIDDRQPGKVLGSALNGRPQPYVIGPWKRNHRLTGVINELSILPVMNHKEVVEPDYTERAGSHAYK